MYPLFEGNACLPQDAGKEGATCRLGGLPVYSVNATSASQVQLAVNFARTLNLRLVIRNTGHDFLGKSTGAGALNIWTHNLKKMQFIENYKSAGSYKGPAFKIGAGIQVVELYEAANKYGYTAVGGECRVSRQGIFPITCCADRWMLDRWCCWWLHCNGWSLSHVSYCWPGI